MRTIILRGGVEVEGPLELALEFLEKYSGLETAEPSEPASFDEADLRRANRGGARTSGAEIAAVLERRGAIEHALRQIEPDASLADGTRSIPWAPLRHLFDAFADIRGIGFSKMTKALHPKRPALIPMLDSFVERYLTAGEPTSHRSAPFGERASALVRAYKLDLDGNRSVLRATRRELARRGHQLTEVRILDVVIWSVAVGTPARDR